MNYPHIVTQEWLDSQRTEHDRRIVRVELTGCFNYRPVPVAGKRNKRYHFLYDPTSTCHVLKIPETVWMAENGAMARDLMQSQNNSYTLTILILPLFAKEPAKAVPLPPAPKAKTRKHKSAEDAALAVLGG